MKIYILLLLLFLGACTFGQSHWLTPATPTKWQEADDVKFISKGLTYHPDIPMDDRGSRQLAQIKLRVTFKNTSQKAIKSVTFEIVLFCEYGLKRLEPKPCVYNNLVQPNEKASFLYEPTIDGLTAPDEQIVRIINIQYEDGSCWGCDMANE